MESTKQGVKYLKIIQQQFDFFLSSNKSKISRYMLEETPELKIIKEQQNEKIRELSSDKAYWISTNFDTFMSRLDQDEEEKRKRDTMMEQKKQRTLRPVSFFKRGSSILKP